MRLRMGKKTCLIRLGLCLGVLLAAFSASAAEQDIQRAFLNWRQDWPEFRVRVPIEVMRMWLRDQILGFPDTTPFAPVELALPETEVHANIAGDAASLQLNIDLLAFRLSQPIHMTFLPAGIAWQDVRLNGEEVTLLKDGPWLVLDVPPERLRELYKGQLPVPLHFTARAELKAGRWGDERKVSISLPRSCTTLLNLDSDEALQVQTNRSPLSLTGTSEGTHGTLAILPGDSTDQLIISWRPPQPVAAREGHPECESYVSWSLGEGVQEVQALLNIRIIGGQRDQLQLRLPQGAERLAVTGPDVREIRPSPTGAAVYLKGRIMGATQLSVQFTLPWPAGKGRVAIDGFGLADGRTTGGALVVTGGDNGVILAEDARGLSEIALWDIPKQVTALSVSPPILGYAITGDWRLEVDVVSVTELPMRETIVDKAEHTILLRPDGMLMQKLRLHMRNRTAQYLHVLPPLDERPLLLLARVSDRVVTVSRASDGGWLIPLDKSLQTLEGAVSFSVELAFIGQAPKLTKKGELNLPLPAMDVPVAQTLCAVYLPKEMDVREWSGPLRVSETIEASSGGFQYGLGMLQKAISPDLVAENRLRAALKAYGESDVARAGKLARQTLEDAPESAAAEEAKKLLSNVMYFEGSVKVTDRAGRALARQIQKEQSASNESIILRQQDLLQKGWANVRAGQTLEAEDAFRAANLAGEALKTTTEGAREQEALLSEANRWIAENEVSSPKKSDGSDLLTGDEISQNIPAPNVAASGQVAQQRASGKWSFSTLPQGSTGSTQDGIAIPEVKDELRERVWAQIYEEDKRSRDEERLKLREKLIWPGAVVQYPANRDWEQISARSNVELPSSRAILKPSENVTFALKDVSDLVQNEKEGEELAEFIGRNYETYWGADTDSYLWDGGAQDAEKKAYRNLLYVDGRVAWKNGEKGDQIASAIENLGTNLYQKVPFNMRELGIADTDAANLGVRWNDMTNGRWAEIDEGMMNALVAYERDNAQKGVALRRVQEIIPGTSVPLPNGAVIGVEMAQDDKNKLSLNGAEVELPHKQALLVESNGRILIVRGGATQFWKEEANAPEIPEAPLEIEVPAIGRAYQLEKTLLNPMEELSIQAQYELNDSSK